MAGSVALYFFLRLWSGELHHITEQNMLTPSSSYIKEDRQIRCEIWASLFSEVKIGRGS